MVFYPDFLILDDKTAVAMRFVESMRFPNDAEDATIARLKDDVSIEIVMCSGRNYTISTKSQFIKDDWRLDHEGIAQARFSIFEKWKHIITGKSE